LDAVLRNVLPLHRAHARVEDRIRCAKDTALGQRPSREFAINSAWYTAATIAADLICWLQLLALDGDLALAEPKRLRYRVLHTAARLTRGQRRRRLHIPATWPWAAQITTAFTRIAAIPAPGRPHSAPHQPPEDPADHAHRRDRRLTAIPAHTSHRQTTMTPAG
jgi:hypothetical protein